MVLRLDPAHPLVWRTPSCVQFGVEHPVAVLDEVLPVEEFAIGLLARGVSRVVAEGLLAERGCGPARFAGFLARLGPAVVDVDETAVPPPGPWVAVDGRGQAAESIASQFASGGARLGSPDDPVELAVVVSAFATAPRRAAAWLRRDIPQLLVEFGDRSVRVGPVVRPGAGSCASCLELARRDADPYWPAVASQLVDRAAPAADALGIAVAVPLVERVAREHLADPGCGWGDHAVRWLHPVRGSSPRAAGGPSTLGDALVVERVRPHPECGCRSPEGNGRADDRLLDAPRPPPTTARAVPVPA